MRALLDAIPDLMFRIAADGIYLDFVGDAELLANPWEDVVGGQSTSSCRLPSQWRSCGRFAKALDDGRAPDAELRAPDDARRRAPVRGQGCADRRQPGRDDRPGRDRSPADGARASSRHDRLVSPRCGAASARTEPPRRCAAAADRRPPGARVAFARLPHGGDGAAELLQRAEEQLALTVPVRELARGLHPSVLAEHGLPAAARQLVSRLRRPAGRLDVSGLALRPRLRGVHLLPRRRGARECRQVRGRVGGDRSRARGRRRGRRRRPGRRLRRRLPDGRR